MRSPITLTMLLLFWLAASMNPAMAQGCDDCQELKQELRKLRTVVAQPLIPAPASESCAVASPCTEGTPAPTQTVTATLVSAPALAAPTSAPVQAMAAASTSAPATVAPRVRRFTLAPVLIVGMAVALVYIGVRRRKAWGPRLNQRRPD